VASPVLPLRLSSFGEGFGAFDVVLAGDIGLHGRVGRGHRGFEVGASRLR
jgi:hypothetical protein